MGATDTTTLIVDMIQQMMVRNQQMEEQRRTDLQAAQEQRLDAEERSRRDMQRILQESGLDKRQRPHAHRRSILHHCFVGAQRHAAGFRVIGSTRGERRSVRLATSLFCLPFS